MTRSNTPLFRYRPADTPLHGMPALLKLTALFTATILAFSGSLPALALLTLLLPALALASRLSRESLPGAARTLALWTIMIALFRIVGKPLTAAVIGPELAETGMYAWRLAVVMFAGTIFYETTSGMEIRDALFSIQECLYGGIAFFRRMIPFAKHKTPLRLPDFAFLLSLTLVFIPRVFEAWSNLEMAWRARCGDARRGFAAPFTRITTLVPLFVLRLLALAAETDRAIRNRSR